MRPLNTPEDCALADADLLDDVGSGRMLELLALRQGHTITKDMFLNQLYGGMDEPDQKIIDVFICKLRKKLAEASGGKNYIETRLGSRVRASGARAGEARRVDSPLPVNRELPRLHAVDLLSGVLQLGMVSLRYGHRTGDEANESVKAGLVHVGF